MMAASRIAETILDRLPATRGPLMANASLAELTWFRVGGPAEVLFSPEDADDLAAFLAACPLDVPLTVIGLGSNLLVRDGGVDGVVIRLGRAFRDIKRRDNGVIAGAGASDISVAAFARDAGLAGLEFLRGIPGTIGGALRMNAGAYSREIADIFLAADAVARDGQRLRLAAADMGFSYRHTKVADDVIFLAGEFAGTPDDLAAIAARMEEINAAREESQPLRTRTGGSTFKNPENARAWQLIDAAGCRGLRSGGAQVSEKHCNFLINTGNATAEDIEALGEEVRRRVRASSGVDLQWEIRIIGRPAVGRRGA